MHRKSFGFLFFDSVEYFIYLPCISLEVIHSFILLILTALTHVFNFSGYNVNWFFYPLPKQGRFLWSLKFCLSLSPFMCPTVRDFNSVYIIKSSGLYFFLLAVSCTCGILVPPTGDQKVGLLVMNPLRFCLKMFLLCFHF